MKILFILTLCYLSSTINSIFPNPRQDIGNSSHSVNTAKEDSNGTKGPQSTSANSQGGNKTIGFILTHNVKSLSIEKGKAEERIQYFQRPAEKASSKNTITYQKLHPKNKLAQHPQIINHHISHLRKPTPNYHLSTLKHINNQKVKNAYARVHHASGNSHEFQSEPFEEDQPAKPEVEEESYPNQQPQQNQYYQTKDTKTSSESQDNEEAFPQDTDSNRATYDNQQNDEEDTTTEYKPQPVVSSYAPTTTDYQSHAQPQTLQQGVMQPIATSALPQTTVQVPTTTIQMVQYPATTQAVTVIPLTVTPQTVQTTQPTYQSGIVSCPEEIESLGCFVSSPSAQKIFPDLIIQKNSGQSLEEFLCSCATLVQNKGQFTLSLQQNACYAGGDETLYDSQGATTSCINDLGSTCSDSDTYCQGAQGSMSVYTVITPNHKGITKNIV